MIIGFKPRFKEPILAGTKIHTIREDPKHRWRPGLMMQMATGVRTKNYDCFNETPFISYQRVFMSYDHMLHISIDNAAGKFALSELYYPEKEILAANDGFQNVKEFEEWFIDAVRQKDGHVLSAKILHWTDFRY